jgi:hypothetical protein
MPRFVGICALLAALLAGVCCQAQEEFDHSSIMNAPGSDPYDLWGSCYQKFIYVSPLQQTYVNTDFVAFRRDWQQSQAFATLGSTDHIVLSTSDLQTVYQPGMRVLVGRRLNDWFALEASYLGLFQSNVLRSTRNISENALGTEGNLFSPFSNFGNPPEVGFDYNDFASIRIQSTMDNAEINLRQRLSTPPCCLQASALFGVRYMAIREQFEYRTDSAEPTPGGTTNYGYVTTRNGLIGAQTGITVEFQVEQRWWLNLEAKFLMMYNGASQETQFNTGPLAGPGTPITGQRDGDRVSLGGDVAITGIWRFTPSIIGRLGYQCVFVDGLALASENFTRNVPVMTVGPDQLDYEGHLAFHGPFIGLTITW